LFKRIGLYNNSLITKHDRIEWCEESNMDKMLVEALKNAFDMQKEDAVNLAKTVENIFDGNKEIEDMTIDKYARALFYELQRQKLLKIRREEIKEQGKKLRKFYWSFDKKMIKEKAHKKRFNNSYQVYAKIPTDVWIVRSTRNT